MAVKKMSGVYVSWPKPDFEYTVKTNKHFRRNFHGAMLYAHYELSAVELKREVAKYLRTKHPDSAFLERIKDMHENRFTTIGKYMYLLNHGCDIPDDIMTGLLPALEKVVHEEEIRVAAAEKASANITDKENNGPEASTITKTVISIQDRLRDKAREIAGEVEGWIDDFTLDKKQPVKTVDDFVNMFKANNLKAPHVRYIQDIFQRRADEISAAADGKNKELSEAYSNYTKPELKKLDLIHKNLLKSCEMLQEVAKVERAPRKKKPVSIEKLVSKLKFKKEDTSLGIVSLSPSQIIGAKEVWWYNTKTRKLAQYKAEDAAGLGVKGASLLNFSADSAEKTLRKPGEALAEFKKASKVKLRTFLKDLSTVDIPCNGKINEHHILLRIDK
jgi:hypothetical protein